MADRVLSYRGYTGSIEASLDDDLLFGQILFINDLVNYEGATLQELRKAFEGAVDFYLEKCREEGLEADKPFGGSFNVRVSPELHKAACVKAAERGVSLNEFVKEAMASAIADEKVVINETHHHQHTHVQRLEFAVAESIDTSVRQWETVPTRQRQRVN